MAVNDQDPARPTASPKTTAANTRSMNSELASAVEDSFDEAETHLFEPEPEEDPDVPPVARAASWQTSVEASTSELENRSLRTLRGVLSGFSGSYAQVEAANDDLHPDRRRTQIRAAAVLGILAYSGLPWIASLLGKFRGQSVDLRLWWAVAAVGAICFMVVGTGRLQRSIVSRRLGIACAVGQVVMGLVMMLSFMAFGQRMIAAIIVGAAMWALTVERQTPANESSDEAEDLPRGATSRPGLLAMRGAERLITLWCVSGLTAGIVLLQSGAVLRANLGTDIMDATWSCVAAAALFSAGAIALALRPRTWVLKPIFAALALLMLQLGPRALSWTVLTAVGLCCVVELFSFLVAIESTPRKHPLHALSRRAARLYVELACVDRMRRRLPMVWGFCGVVALGALLEPVWHQVPQRWVLDSRAPWVGELESIQWNPGPDASELVAGRFAGQEIRQARSLNLQASGAKLSGARLSDVDWAGAQLVRADFTRARVERVRWVGANLNEAHLEGLQAHSLDCTRASLRGASFRGALLQRAQFVDADLAHTDLRGVDLLGANFAGANLEGVHWQSTRCPDGSWSDHDVQQSCIAHLGSLAGNALSETLGVAPMQELRFNADFSSGSGHVPWYWTPRPRHIWVDALHVRVVPDGAQQWLEVNGQRYLAMQSGDYMRAMGPAMRMTLVRGATPSVQEIYVGRPSDWWSSSEFYFTRYLRD